MKSNLRKPLPNETKMNDEIKKLLIKDILDDDEKSNIEKLKEIHKIKIIEKAAKK